ncbi:lipoprotein insertase outer membrane protein LolB [Pelagibaculum spongiae]|uniref:Outer-membrane lipoprotein LolB n=1 Tax=Pelagibaculum spongiae TaxID=2080658 RepID=A0A2V1H5J2_9GAMM|nr:lipoprotein insertase outer membrane protein LolB [Pelagibaculum spongiae]PVZ72528.1 outer membrane lipoprotein LolB [Pelagibaculum spongiae]
MIVASKFQRCFSVLIVSLTLLLNGCGLFTANLNNPPASTINQPILEAQALQNWKLKGRIGLISGDKAWSASLNWQQQQQQFDITIAGAFGIGRTHLVGNTDAYVIKSSDTELNQHQARLWLHQELGLTLPIAALPYWVRGLPWPKYPHQQTEKGFTQGNWTIAADKFKASSGFNLPSRVKIQIRDKTTDQKDLKVTLAIKNWQAI